MPKQKIMYFCKECGYETSKWMGQCPACKEWNTFVDAPVATVKQKNLGTRTRPCILKEVESGHEERMTSGFSELDRVLGGGIVPGSLVLVGGDPGIGKSTLLLQV